MVGLGARPPNIWSPARQVRPLRAVSALRSSYPWPLPAISEEPIVARRPRTVERRYTSILLPAPAARHRSKFSRTKLPRARRSRNARGEQRPLPNRLNQQDLHAQVPPLRLAVLRAARHPRQGGGYTLYDHPSRGRAYGSSTRTLSAVLDRPWELSALDIRSSKF